MALNREEDISHDQAEEINVKKTTNKKPSTNPAKKKSSQIVGPNFVKPDSETSSSEQISEDRQKHKKVRAISNNSGLRPSKNYAHENHLEQMIDEEKVFKTADLKKKVKKQKQQQPQ